VWRFQVAVAAVCAVSLVAACTGDEDEPRASGSPNASANPTPSTSPSIDTCPARPVEPDAERPRTTLTFSIDAARKVVTGTETIVFTPDLPVSELIFRLWANQPSAAPGTRLEVTSAKSGGATQFTMEAAGGGAGTPGTLLRLPLGRNAPAGEAITADLEFTLNLGGAVFERWGSTGRTAWWGSGHPLLAWERGAGWQTQPAAPVGGEYAVSEAGRYDITVDAPAQDTVLISGSTDAPVAAGAGRRRWHSVNLTARDVSVAVGTFVQRTGSVDGTPVIAAVSSDTAASASVLLDQTTQAMRGLVDLLGPYPYPGLTVVAVPPLGSGGIEYPGGFFVGPRLNPTTVTHEVAHEWFYGMVGDNQARDPWLDEAFATYSEAVVNDKAAVYGGALGQPGDVGAQTGSFASGESRYFDVVYRKGAAALLAARRQAGAPAFDAAVRCYLNANAWQVATPSDIDRAFTTVPAARTVLRDAGAL
jgi:hypothetical protein